FIANTTMEANRFALNADPAAWTDDVYRLYSGVLDRAPDAAEFANHLQQLSTGTSYLDVVRGFVASPAFQTDYGGLDNTDFVTLLYTNILGRTPDAAGLAEKVARLDSGGSREAEVVGFVQSPEFTQMTAGALKDWVRAQGVDDMIEGGGGQNVLAGGEMTDTFVFAQTDAGTNTVLDLEPWDYLSFEGFGYATADDARAHLTVSANAVVFADQGTEVTFQNVGLDQFDNAMFIV
ncbi:MAG: DUF4214 domain-containing protein, partial [Thalassovita sp.]